MFNPMFNMMFILMFDLIFNLILNLMFNLILNLFTRGQPDVCLSRAAPYRAVHVVRVRGVLNLPIFLLLPELRHRHPRSHLEVAAQRSSQRKQKGFSKNCDSAVTVIPGYILFRQSKFI